MGHAQCLCKQGSSKKYDILLNNSPDGIFNINQNDNISNMFSSVRFDSKSRKSRKALSIRSISLIQKDKKLLLSVENILSKLLKNLKLTEIKSGKLSNSINEKENNNIVNAIEQKELPSPTEKEEDIQSEDLSNISNSYHMLSLEEEDHIMQTMKNNFVLNGMTQELLDLILNDLIYLTFPKGQIIYNENDEGSSYFLIANGQIESSQKSKAIKIYNQWDSFGELILITQCKRDYTMTSLTDVSLFAIDGENFRDFKKRISDSILRERFTFLNTIAIFETLDNISKFKVAEKIKNRYYETNEKIISKGDYGDALFIIKEGLVSCRNGLQEIRKLGNNDYFGQNAIIIDEKRSLDVIALKKSLCYELTRKDLLEALGPDFKNVILFCFFKKCVLQTNYLSILFGENDIEEVFRCFKLLTYNYNQLIIEPIENGSSKNVSDPKSFENNKKIVLVIEGSIYTQNPFELYADKGKILGEEFFKDCKNNLPHNLIAIPDCITLEADAYTIAQKLKLDFTHLKPLNLFKVASKLRKLYLFKGLSINTLKQLAKQTVKQKYKPNEVIVKEGTTGNSFYLISKGRVRVSQGGKVVRDLDSYFGENALVSKDQTLRTATVTAITNVSCWILSKKEFDFILGDETIKNYLTKKISLQNTSIELQDLHYIKFLGKGKFGSVSLVHNKKNIYAIKAVSRASVERQKYLAKYFINERRIMLSLDHPFIVKMVKSLHNDYFCFFLIEYVNGKNLDEHLSYRTPKQDIFESQFYVGSMILMLEYLQRKHIAHRDIKPPNIMIDSNGYLKMIDFGTAKIITDYTSTVIGTPHYIAPEILKGKGYSLSCDFWSVGICVYEIFYGMYPFGHYAQEVIEIYREVLHKEFSVPKKNEKFNKVNSFIKDLLNKKVNLRCTNTDNLKKKPFFDDFDFDKLSDFKYVPPFIPKTLDLTEYLSLENPFINYINEDCNCKSIRKNRNERYPPGYTKNWYEEF